MLKVKSGTSNDLIYFELERPDIVSRVKDKQFHFCNKLSLENHGEAVVKFIIDMCINDKFINYYKSLHGRNTELNLSSRKERILTSNKSMIMYYRKTVSLSKCLIYNNLANDFYRYIIARWRLSNHSLKN